MTNVKEMQCIAPVHGAGQLTVASGLRAKQTVWTAQFTRLERGRLRNRHAGEASGRRRYGSGKGLVPVRDEFGVDAGPPGHRGAARVAERLVPPGQRLGEEAGVVRDEFFLAGGDAAVLADRVHRAHRLAGAAVDALAWV